MLECARKAKPKKDDTTQRLAASLPSLGRIGSIDDNTRPKHGERNKKKGRRGTKFPDSRTTSMNVEIGNSSSSTADSNASSSEYSSESCLVKVDIPLIEEPESSDFNGNDRVITPSTDESHNHKSWHGNGKVSASVGDGIFTESPPSSQYFPVCRQYFSSREDGIGQRMRYKSFVDDNEEKEVIPMKHLRHHWSSEQQQFPGVGRPRNCHSVGELT